MLLYSAQIAAGSPQELDAARMPKCMRMKLGQTHLLAWGLDDLEDPVVSHAFLTPPSTFDHDGPGDLRERHRCFMPAFTE